MAAGAARAAAGAAEGGADGGGAKGDGGGGKGAGKGGKKGDGKGDGKTSKKDIKARQDLHLAGKFPAVAGHWCLGEFQNAKGVVFLIIAHSGGVQVALKERNAAYLTMMGKVEAWKCAGSTFN
mgnify:CR=1 FL=1